MMAEAEAYADILYEKKGPVARITINRPRLDLLHREDNHG